jgi:hypothetical protein
MDLMPRNSYLVHQMTWVLTTDEVTLHTLIPQCIGQSQATHDMTRSYIQ